MNFECLYHVAICSNWVSVLITWNKILLWQATKDNPLEDDSALHIHDPIFFTMLMYDDSKNIYLSIEKEIPCS